MFIVLKNCTPSCYEDEIEKMSALINLLASHGLRKNILVAPKNVFEEVIDSDLYSKNDKRYAADALLYNREHGSLKNKLLIHAIVDFNETSIDVRKMNDKYEVKVGFDLFQSPINAEATPFISENESDYNFYKTVGHYYSNQVSELKLGINLSHHLGAGSHSKAQFDKLSCIHPFLLCIVDNDKAHPRKGEGSTSSVFKNYDREFNSGKIAKVIDVREVESLIPKFILKEVFEYSSSAEIDALNEIILLSECSPEFRVYFDHKDGLTLKKAIELDKRYGEFWLPLLSNIHRFARKECVKTKICTDCEKCPALSGLGNSLLNSTNRKIEITNPHKFKRLLESNLQDFWSDIGYFVLSWGCVSNTKLSRA